MNQFAEGFILQASLILALGAQNIFILESGLKKRRHFLVAALCSACDLLLIAIGVLGAATIFVQVPFLKTSFGCIGVLFLIYYGIKKIGEGFKSQSLMDSGATPILASTRQVVMLALGFSLLNPHVYLDTVILVGGYSTKFRDLIHRLLFGLGAGSFSVIWFFGLSFFASTLSRLLNGPRAMRFISFLSGLILLALSWKLGRDVYGWMS